MPTEMKGVIIEPEDADLFVIHLPDGTYVAVFPYPLCKHKDHRQPEEAAKCEEVKNRMDEGKRNERFGVRPTGGYL